MLASLVALSLQAGSADEPPPLPSGMDLLYSDRIAFLPSGEPIVTIGLMTGQSQVVVTADATLHVDFWESGVFKRATLQPGQQVRATVRRAEPAKRRHYVDLDGVEHGKDSRLDWAMSAWRARGYAVEALEEGTVLGIGGRVLDNREARIVIPAKDAREASQLVQEVYRRFGQRAVVKSRLVERPWGELRLDGPGPLGNATSFVRFMAVRAGGAAGTLTVRQVEHSTGYAWHGTEDRSYRGEVYAVVDPDGKLAAVNVLGAEGVLESVVPSEMFASAPAEALRAQAIAARNHLLAMLGRRHHGDPFHLCAEQHCQVYSGIGKEDPRTTAAVRATSGEALFHSGALVHATYSSTCGGHTEDNDAVWGNQPQAALRARPDYDLDPRSGLTAPAALDEVSMRLWVQTTADSYCSRPRQVRQDKLRWQKRMTASELDKLVAPQFPAVGPVREIVVKERGPGGRIISLELRGARGTASVLYELPIRQLFGNLSSGAFVIDHERDADGTLVAVVFRGAGWGHGVGMCQLGAIGRADAGHPYGDILRHYFNGAEVVRLYGSPLAP